MNTRALLLVAICACTDKEEPEPVDSDLDGWSLDEDCDDTDPTIYPDAPEICGDGVPNACGRTEAEATELCDWAGEVDLRDAPLTVLGVDQDDYVSEGVIADLNGDGALDLAAGGWGVDAVEAGAGMVFVMFGGGSFVTTPGELGVVGAELAIAGDEEDAHAGRALAAGDVDGDGGAELLIGATGANEGAGGAFLFRSGGVISSDDDDRGTYEAELRLSGMAADDQAGVRVAMLPDADGDGLLEVVVGASLAGADDGGAAYVLWSSGAAAGDGDLALSEADLVLEGAEEKDRAGVALAGLADVDGDGLGDLAVGAPKGSPDGVEVGAVYLALGGGSSGSLADADVLVVGVADGDLAGTAVADAGDVDGDGVTDLIVGAPGATGEAEGAGVAYLIQGASLAAAPGRLGLELAAVTMLGAVQGDAVGGSVGGGGDLDGDGRADLVVGGIGVDGDEDGQGAAWLLNSGGALAGAAGSLSLTAADARFLGHEESTEAGSPVSFAPDLDGDGASELMIGASGHDEPANNAGAIYLLLHPGI